MRYLVRARVKPGREQALLKAIEEGTLGQGSVAEGEYLRNMQDGEALRGRDRSLGGDLLLPDSVAGGARILGAVLRIDASAGCA